MTQPNPQKPKYQSVMLIDDNEIDNFIDQKMIEGCNFAHNIYIHTSSKSALEFLTNLQRNKEISDEIIPQVIFLDINMPILDGFQFIHEFEKLDKRISGKSKVVFLTSSINPQDLEKAKMFKSVIKYVNKPLNKVHLDAL